MDPLPQAILAEAVPLDGHDEALDAALESVGDARVVLLGEATHGTHEFYRDRARLTQRLVREKGFNAIAVEGDWPDCARVDRFVRGRSADASAAGALADFKRFPAWMWRNTDVLGLVEWLRGHNAPLEPARQVRFHGLDLYSLHASMEAVIAHLEAADPLAAARARARFDCFDRFGDDPQSYGAAVAWGGAPCEEEALQQLLEIKRRNAYALEAVANHASADARFDAERNAAVVAGAERYYRTMFEGDLSSWNLRDTHMADTLDALLEHLDRTAGGGNVVVWAHNSHIGDARATGMGTRGELNIGQLVRQRHGRERTRLIGFTTYSGTVTAASAWGTPPERKRVRPALPDTCEDVFHRTGLPAFFLDLRDPGEALGGLRETRLERFIGVLYLPETERRSHYSSAALVPQFDAVFHYDVSHAVEPLEPTAEWVSGEPPETFPTGM